ncbi:MAG TPA: hypothetical protein VFL82_02880 [Thermomicrobiales bacterium]|nr:hypothetical protein [Thermomicrobiales bacterium]
MATTVPQNDVQVTFHGSKAQQQRAQEIYQLVTARGRFMAANAPIRVTVGSILEYLQKTDQATTEEDLTAMIDANAEVFALESVNGEQMLVTSRTGQLPRPPADGTGHSFVHRFMQPLPKPVAPATPIRERPRIDPSWASLDLGDLDLGLEEPAAVEEVVEPVAIVEEPEVVEAEPVEVEEPAVSRTITVPAAPATDVQGVDDVELAAAIANRLGNDPRVANFGDQWMLEDHVPRFSRGDLRRLKEYIQEQEQPLTDDVLVQDVLHVRPGSPDFDLTRFAINFRLSREHRDFDFVGTANQRFWSINSAPQIGTTRRKPNEIGTDYRYLLDEMPEHAEYRSLRNIDHVLTFYEYYLGLLPYDAELQALMPAPLLPNQRSAVLTFECPQSYTTYLVELRYPTPNRGGFILGLDDFFSENLVPGSLMSITATENDGHFIVEYLAAGNQNARLLELEDRRQRYVFRPTTFVSAVDDDFLLTEERFPRLAGEKPLDEKVRRRPEAVIAATFERVGEQNEVGAYSASFADLLAAANIERPFSAQLLRSTLDQDESGAFARDPEGSDVYTYVPGNPS